MSERHVTRDFTLPSDLSEVHRVQAEIEEALQSNRFGDSDVFAIKLAVEEALVNAIKHGNQMEPDKAVRVGYTVTDEQFSIRIEDEGVGFSMPLYMKHGEWKAALGYAGAMAYLAIRLWLHTRGA